MRLSQKVAAKYFFFKLVPLLNACTTITESPCCSSNVFGLHHSIVLSQHHHHDHSIYHMH